MASGAKDCPRFVLSEGFERLVAVATFYNCRPSEFFKLSGLQAFMLDEAAAYYTLEKRRIDSILANKTGRKGEDLWP